MPSCTPPGCDHSPLAASPAPQAPSARAAPAASAAAAGEPPGTELLNAKEGWLELVRLERWDEAAAVLEALPEARKSQPEVRLVRARLAMLRSESATAVKLLDGLEKRLTVVSDDIERWRAESQLVSGPFEEAARYFERQGGAKALGKAAAAMDRAGRADEARAIVDKALASGGLGAEVEGGLRALRMRLAEARGQNAVAVDDARWICTHVPGARDAETAEQVLVRLDKAHPLTGKERLTRADRLADAGHSDEALAELGRAASAPTPPTTDELDWARAFAFYRSRSHYDKATTLFDQLGARAGGRQAEALFYAARARSRADRDEDAMKGYTLLRRKFPQSPFSEEAAYLSARLTLLHGRWSEAATRYAQYLKQHPKGRQVGAASYERAIALLAAGQARNARVELHKLATAASRDDAARLRELEAVAAHHSGDREDAVKLWQEVNEAQPMSWAALTARARLGRLGYEKPPLLAPPEGDATEPPPSAATPPAAASSPIAAAYASAGQVSAAAASAPSPLLPTPAPPVLSAPAPAPTSPAPPSSFAAPAPSAVPLPPEWSLPAAAALYHRLGLDGEAEAYLRAHERDATQAAAGREKQVLCAMYDEIGRATRRYRLAAESIPQAVLARAPSAATIWAWDCLYPRPYPAIVDMLEEREKLPKGLVYAVMRQESAYDPDAISPVKAVGLLQLMPDTARRVALEAGQTLDEKTLHSPSVNLDLGARYLAKLLRTFGGSLPLAVAAYNAGPRAVSRWVERMRGVDLDVWVALIPYEETRKYVIRVMSNFARYTYRQGGEAVVPNIDLTTPKTGKLEASAF